MASLGGEPSSATDANQAERIGVSSNVFLDAVTGLNRQETIVPSSEVVPHGVAQEQALVGEKLSSRTVQTLNTVLTSEVRHIMKIAETDKSLLEANQATLLKKAQEALGENFQKDFTDIQLYSAIHSLVTSGDSTIRRVMEEIGDRVARHQLARMQVEVDAKYGMDPADKEEYVARASQVPQTANFGEISDPRAAQRPEKAWFGKRLGDWLLGTYDTSLVHPRGIVSSAPVNIPGVGPIWFPTELSLRPPKHKTTAGITVTFPEDAKLHTVRTLNGKKDHETWLGSQPWIKTGTGQPLLDQDKTRIKDEATARIAAILEISVKRHGGSLYEEVDLNFVKAEVDTPDTFKTSGSGSRSVNMGIEGLDKGALFPTDFRDISPQEQLDVLTTVLDTYTSKQLESIKRNEFVGSRVEQALAKAENDVAESKKGERYKDEIKEGQRKIDGAERQIQAIDAVKAADKALEMTKDQISKKENALSDVKEFLTAKISISPEEKTLEGWSVDYEAAESKKNTASTEASSLQQQNEKLQAQIANPDDKHDKAVLTERVEKNKQERVVELEKVRVEEAKMRKLNAVHVRFVVIESNIGTLTAELQTLENTKQSQKRAKEYAETEFNNSFDAYINSQPDVAAANARKKKKLVLDRRKNILANLDTEKEAAVKRKEAATTEKARFEELKSSPDAGAEYRAGRIKTVQENFFNPTKSEKMLHRASLGRVDIVIPDPASPDKDVIPPASHDASTEIQAYMGMKKGAYPPAYLHMAYVLMGKEALAQTPAGEEKLKEAARIISPQEFYKLLQSQTEWKSFGVANILASKAGVMPGTDFAPDSVYDAMLQDHEVANAMLQMMTPDVMTRIMDKAMDWGAEGYQKNGLQTGYVSELTRLADATQGKTEVYLAKEKHYLEASKAVVKTALTAQKTAIESVAIPGFTDKANKIELAILVQSALDKSSIVDVVDIKDDVVTDWGIDLTSEIFGTLEDSVKTTAIKAMATQLVGSPVPTEDLKNGTSESIQKRVEESCKLVGLLSKAFTKDSDNPKLALLQIALPLAGTDAIRSIMDAYKEAVVMSSPVSIDTLIIAGGNRLKKLIDQINAPSWGKMAENARDVLKVPAAGGEELKKAYEFLIDNAVSEISRPQAVETFNLKFAHINPGPEMMVQIKLAMGPDTKDHECAVINHLIAEHRRVRRTNPAAGS